MLAKTAEPAAMTKNRLLPGICAGIVLAIGAGLCSPVYAINPGIPGGGLFELDGNATQNNSAKDDWDKVLYKDVVTNGTIIATTSCTNGSCVANWPGVLADPPGKSLFVQGSKDLSEMDGWSCRDQGAPDKDELTNAYAVAYNVGGELVAFFGADRYDNSGTATMGFWLLQAAIAQPKCIPAGNGKFVDAQGNPASHAVGDLLVVADFSNGGAIGTIRVFKWVGSGGSDGSLNLLFEALPGSNAAVDCANNISGDICGIINQTPVASPWPYIPKGASGDSDFIRYGFMEIGVNLSHIFGGATVPCYSTFVAETRSSAEPNAAQKDFVLGSFNVCGIGVSKICTNNQPNLNVTPATFTYDAGGCLINTGFGAVSDFTIADSADPPNPAEPLTLDNLRFFRPGTAPTSGQCDSDFGALQALAATGTQIGTTADIQPGEKIIWLANFTSSVNGQHDIVTATAHSAGGGPALAPATDSAICPSRSFAPGISVTKNCEVYLDDTSGRELVVKSRITGDVCNTGDTPLNDVTVIDSTAGGTPGNDMANPILTVSQLPAQANYPTVDCGETSPSVAHYDVIYTPNKKPGDTRYTFADDVTATGTPPSGTGEPQGATAHAVCSLCPTCLTCTTTTSTSAPTNKMKPHQK
jgi:hypothetical protein